MEIRHYIEIIRHWLWLLLLGLVLGASIAYVTSLNQARVFQTSTRVQVMSAPMSGSSDYTYWTDTQLANTYVQTLKTQPILDEVGAQLGLTVSSSQVTTKVVSSTQLIDIFVEDTDPQRAADIANKLVAVFAEKNNQLQSSRFLESEQSLQGQIQQIDAQIQAFQAQSTAATSAETEATLAKAKAEIARLEKEILTLQTEIDALTPSTGLLTPVPTLSIFEKSLVNEKKLRLTQLQNTYNLYQQIAINLTVLGVASTSGNNNTTNDKLQSTLALYEQIRANLLGSYESVRLARLNSTSNIVQIEPAVARFNPIRPQTTQNTALGGAVGLLLAAAIVFLVEYLDDTLKTAEQITKVLGLPVIGYIADIKHKKDSAYVLENPRSPVSEAFRTLRTNLEFASVDKPIKSLLIVSANPAEGKSTVAANLAISFTQGGKKVLLIDADMRRPRIHRFFDLPNRIGLTDLFRESLPMSEVTHPWKDANLTIITSGGIPPNPTDLISSRKMESILETASELADIVIVDAPPFLVADASILASHMDGVLLIVQPGKTPRDTAKTTLEQMNRAGANIVGVVMNRIPRNRSYYYGGYRYYSSDYQGHYYHDLDTNKEKATGIRLGSRLRRALAKRRPITGENQSESE